ncbi:MAG: hypothetical protein H6923_00290 [Alphaproteobacteria bacterium]|nr:hypothetical protein [Alphaproteobacteria bacterium]
MGDPALPGTASLVYVLYLLGFMNGVTAVIGVILAYVSKDQAPDWLKSHYVFQIHTFWKGLLVAVLAIPLVLILIGWLVYLGLFIWLVVRSLKGLQLVTRAQPVADPRTWAF